MEISQNKSVGVYNLDWLQAIIHPIVYWSEVSVHDITAWHHCRYLSRSHLHSLFPCHTDVCIQSTQPSAHQSHQIRNTCYHFSLQQSLRYGRRRLVLYFKTLIATQWDTVTAICQRSLLPLSLLTALHHRQHKVENTIPKWHQDVKQPLGKTAITVWPCPRSLSPPVIRIEKEKIISSQMSATQADALDNTHS